MSVAIFEDTNTHKAVLVCTENSIPFGPVFNNKREAEATLSLLERNHVFDPRTIPHEELCRWHRKVQMGYAKSTWNLFRKTVTNHKVETFLVEIQLAKQKAKKPTDKENTYIN
tara:strand:- start:10842 stop:11180 length:339 start_codon:yes stop_codon:yes gene_type:complete